MGVWLKEIHRNSIAPATYDRYLIVYEKIVEEFGFVYVPDLTSMMVQDYINRLNAQHYSRSTMLKVISLLKIYYKYLISIKAVDYNPTFGVTIPSEKMVNKKTKRVDPLTPEEQDKFIAAAFTYNKNGTPRYRYRYVFIFLLNTGLRIGELAALLKEDVDMENRLIYVKHSVSMVNKRALDDSPMLREIPTKYVMLVHETKTISSERIVPMNDAAYEAAEDMLRNCTTKKSKLFVSNRNGQVINVRNINMCIETIAKQAGIEPFTVHVFRHTFGTDLSNAGVPDREIADLMGHAYTTVTQKYIKKDLGNLKDAVNKI